MLTAALSPPLLLFLENEVCPMQIHELTALARQMKASDIHLSEGLPLMFRVDGRLMQPPCR